MVVWASEVAAGVEDSELVVVASEMAYIVVVHSEPARVVHSVSRDGCPWSLSWSVPVSDLACPVACD